MKQIAIFDAVTRKRLCYLQNAYAIGYTKENGKLWTARFSLPLSDPKRKHCRYFNLVEVFDGDRYVGLFRIMPADDTRENENASTYECEHVLATLMDDVLLGWHEIGNIGVFTRTVLEYILSKQTTQRWVLGECDFTRQYLYGWENENLLTAFFSVPQPFTDEYRWEYDTTVYPWTLHLKYAPEDPKADLRYKKNMIGVTKHTDPGQLCTRLYAYGYGEGVNALNFSELNNGKPYLDSEEMGNYGLIARIWKDERYQDSQSLLDAARAMLARLERPLVSYDVSGVHAGRLAECEPGDIVRVVDQEEGTDAYSRIVSIDKGDVTGASKTANVTIANEKQTIASSVADLADRQRIESVYSQGSTSLFADSFYDNCSPQYPAQMRFFVPENAVHINQVVLDARAVAFRGYTQAVQGGGAYNETTLGGGGATKALVVDGGYYADTSSQIEGRVNVPGFTLGPLTTGTAENHSHTMPYHFHVPYMQGHSHNVDLPAHTHGLNIPNHTHGVSYGIYQGPVASTLQLRIDGTIRASYGQAIESVDIVPWLKTTQGGRIERGWHTIEIIPDGLSRVECNLSVQLFANSRGGGQF